MNKTIDDLRYFLKDSIRMEIDFGGTPQNRGVPAPPLQKKVPGNSSFIELPQFGKTDFKDVNVLDALAGRKSIRNYSKKPLSLKELSFLIWATQGIKRVIDEGHALRTVPSAGCRHAFETYLCVMNVEGLAKGLYRYLPLEHSLIMLKMDENVGAKISLAVMNQPFAGEAAVTFAWTALPYRMEWRYDLAAAKVIAIDVGHVCQNLYIACEAINAGTCAIGAYYQAETDKLIGVDGKDEFTIYLSAVGKRID